MPKRKDRPRSAGERGSQSRWAERGRLKFHGRISTEASQGVAVIWAYLQPCLRLSPETVLGSVHTVVLVVLVRCGRIVFPLQLVPVAPFLNKREILALCKPARPLPSPLPGHRTGGLLGKSKLFSK